MQEENQISELDEVQAQPPDVPVVSPKDGWTTSQGQMTAIFGIISLLLSFLGWHYTPDQIGNLYDLIMHAVTVLGPVIAFAKVLYEYINSRGKIQSNTLWANASLQTGTTPKSLTSGTPSPVTLAGFDLGGLLSGKGWKDPSTYVDLAKIISKTGIVPGPAGKILGEALGSGDPDEIEKALIEAVKALDARVSKLEGQQ